MTDPEDGPGGLNHNHRWNGSFSFNNKEANMPRVILDPEEGIDGLHDTPDHNDKKEDRTSQIGEGLYPTYPRGKTIVYKGELEAADEHGLNRLRQDMRSAFMLGLSSPKLVEIIPNAAFGDGVWGYFARLLPGGLSIPEKIHRSRFHPHGAFARTFQLSLRMFDPRFLLVSGYQEFLDNDTFTYLTVPNYGAPADPKFTINIPVAGEEITLRSNTVVTPSGNARLRFRSDLAPGQIPVGTLVVDFAAGARQALINGNDAMAYFDSDYSNWWDEFIDGLAPGNNDITVEGSGQWDVEYFPRCY